jgi:hypothetical protein
LIVFVECTATRKVKQYIAVFDPDVQADVATATGHGFGRIAAGRIPYQVILGNLGVNASRAQQATGKKDRLCLVKK